MDKLAEKIIMTPKAKTEKSTTLIIERRIVAEDNTKKNDVHVAGGAHKGIVINKTINSEDEYTTPEISLQFRVFLVNGQTGSHTQESRKLLFWFKPQVPYHERATVAQEFFKELVSPQHFPRDYVGFITRLMKLMQQKYSTIRKLEVELKQLEQTKLPVRPSSSDESILGKKMMLTEQKVLELIEDAYPNPVTVEDISKEYNWDQDLVEKHIEKLKEKKLVKAMEHGAFTRVIQHDKDIQIVKQMPAIVSSKQPTIAIITAQYCEKLAVDAMIENKETFVRYTTVGVTPDGSYPASSVVRATRFGESNVYTLGNVGAHRIVCTKLPTLGYTREAITSAGNTTTRLLGTFQKVDYVFIVGVGGGVPHYTDYTKHVRLGDVIVSSAVKPNRAAYTYCENVKNSPDGECTFEYKSHSPASTVIQDIAAMLKEQYDLNGDTQWYDYMKEGLSVLGSQNEHEFTRPSADTDKLYMAIGEKDVIEVAHPQPQDQVDGTRMEGCPRLHLGPIASGRSVNKDARLREAFTTKSQALAFDFESDSVIESIVGNCRDSWALVRGIADYKDGQRKGPWQPYASLAAAALVKTIINSIEPPE
uniref:Winged helix-turn-helix domain-containing protein n=1 Tax=Panstrongylus megistus TaxID=65343 RepID=A0A069DV69_9HEMI